jgi:hypothetical protein
MYHHVTLIAQHDGVRLRYQTKNRLEPQLIDEPAAYDGKIKVRRTLTLPPAALSKNSRTIPSTAKRRAQPVLLGEGRGTDA